MQTEREALMAPTSSAEEQPLSVVKRKRTKRPRQHLPASSSESTTTEEEDMAHCLILLAQGGGAVVDSEPPAPAQAAPVVSKMSGGERYTSRRYTEAATTADGVKAGFYVYECRTCNKCFPTFQALGGHRASHKKPRLLLLPAGAGDDETNRIKPPPPPPPPRTSRPEEKEEEEVTTALSLNSHHHHASSSSSSAAAAGSKQLRVHECSICGAEFASGQALGGHMRRHRPLNALTTTKKESINLELDLNLPAPSDDPPAVVLGLGQFNDGLMLTASALVDCHY